MAPSPSTPPQAWTRSARAAPSREPGRTWRPWRRLPPPRSAAAPPRGNRRHGGLFRLGRRPESLLRECRGRVGRDPRQAQGTAQRRRVRIPAPYRPHRVLHAGTRDRRHLRRAARGRHRPWRHARGDSRAGLRHRQLHAPRARRPRPGLPRRGARPDLGAHRAGALPRGAHHRRRPRGVRVSPRPSTPPSATCPTAAISRSTACRSTTTSSRRASRRCAPAASSRCSPAATRSTRTRPRPVAP